MTLSYIIYTHMSYSNFPQGTPPAGLSQLGRYVFASEFHGWLHSPAKWPGTWTHSLEQFGVVLFSAKIHGTVQLQPTTTLRPTGPVASAAGF